MKKVSIKIKRSLMGTYRTISAKNTLRVNVGAVLSRVEVEKLVESQGIDVEIIS